jgi:hypothetical protein
MRVLVVKDFRQLYASWRDVTYFNYFLLNRRHILIQKIQDRRLIIIVLKRYRYLSVHISGNRCKLGHFFDGGPRSQSSLPYLSAVGKQACCVIFAPVIHRGALLGRPSYPERHYAWRRLIEQVLEFKFCRGLYCQTLVHSVESCRLLDPLGYLVDV